MNEPYLAAAVQMFSTGDKDANLAAAVRLVELAHAQGAALVALPEMFNCLAPFATIVEQAEPVPGPTSDLMSDLAKRLKITLAAGTICERDELTGKCHNTALVFSAAGELLAHYRKMHLFDADVDVRDAGGERRVAVRESRYFAGGDEIVMAETAQGRLGLSICYDLRFAELYRQLADRESDVLLVPSAFTKTTGAAHWEVLLRARAIENQAYLIAANQCGRHAAEIVTYGHSLIVDPWGKIIAKASGKGEDVIAARIDPAYAAEVRRQIPALTHRRVERLQ